MAAKIGGGGGGKFDLGQNSDMNVTPFVDVMLVLLIIFMVVAPLATTSIRIDLPPATPPKDDKGKPPTFISIQDSGQIFVSMGKTALKPSSMALLASDLPPSLGVANPDQRTHFHPRRSPRAVSAVHGCDQPAPAGRLLQDRSHRRKSRRRDLGVLACGFGRRNLTL